MSKAFDLRSKLQPGDQIIATQDRRYPKRLSSDENYSQRVGDILMVNNPNIGDLVGGTGLNGVAHNGRKNVGLGCSFEVGTFRRATPDDPGFLATREQWYPIKNTEIRKLHVKTTLLKCALASCLGVIAYLLLTRVVGCSV